MQERRRFRRLEKDMRVRHHQETDSAVVETSAKDICTGGIRIASDTGFEIGSRLNIEMHIPRTNIPFYAVGEVVWLKENEAAAEKKFDLGVKFVRVVARKYMNCF